MREREREGERVGMSEKRRKGERVGGRAREGEAEKREKEQERERERERERENMTRYPRCNEQSQDGPAQHHSTCTYTLYTCVSTISPHLLERPMTVYLIILLNSSKQINHANVIIFIERIIIYVPSDRPITELERQRDTMCIPRSRGTR